MIVRKNIYINIMLIALLSGMLFNMLHSLLGIDMLKNEFNRQLVLFPYYFFTIIIFIITLVLKNLKPKVSYAFLFFITSIGFLYINFIKTGDFSHVKRVFINLSPFLFYLSLINEKKDYSKNTYMMINICLYVCIVFSFFQIIFNNSVHENRINGIFQGPNSYAMFLLGCLMVYFKTKNKPLVIICILLIFFTKSSSAILILLFCMFLYYFNIKTFILSILVVCVPIFALLYFYNKGDNQMLDKILFIYNYFSSLTLEDLKYLSHYDSAFSVPDISGEVISPLNRVIQFNYYLFNTTFFEFIFGSSHPRFYESLLLILLSNFGLFSMLLIGMFGYLTAKRLNIKLLRCLFYSMLFFSFFALPVFSMSFSSWFVMASLYTSIKFSKLKLAGVQLEKM